MYIHELNNYTEQDTTFWYRKERSYFLFLVNESFITTTNYAFRLTVILNLMIDRSYWNFPNNNHKIRTQANYY